MAEPFIGEIRMFGGNFAPQGWALCHGQLAPISQNDMLFTLIGTTYGGDGQTTFALPDLRGRFPMHMGSGAGLSPRVIGQTGGAEEVTLTIQQLPQHNHAAIGAAGGNAVEPVGNFWSADAAGNTAAYNNATDNSQMAAGAIGNAHVAQPHENVQPFLAINYIIALEGIFPSQG
jgi:microcystin-dependent protein